MKLPSRITILLGLLACGWCGQTLLIHRLEAAGPLPVVSLVRGLSEFPLELGPWECSEKATSDAPATYGDDHVWRAYRHGETGQTLRLWIVYSARGEDRGHHPDICMAVAGQAEDRQVRQTLPLPGRGEPAQQYRFTSRAGSQWVFYWYYTLQARRDEGVSQLERFYRRMRYRPSSVTAEVFAPEHASDAATTAREFVRLADAALREQLPIGAVRGSRRSPVTVVDARRG